MQPEHTQGLNWMRLVREQIATITEVYTVMSLDDVDLWLLYLEALDEASIPKDK